MIFIGNSELFNDFACDKGSGDLEVTYIGSVIQYMPVMKLLTSAGIDHTANKIMFPYDSSDSSPEAHIILNAIFNGKILF